MQRLNLRIFSMDALVAVVAGGGLAALVGLNPGLPPWAPAVPLALGALGLGWRSRRWIRRATAGDAPPEAVARVIETQVHFYRRLQDEGQRQRFMRDIHYFLLEQRIVGVGVEVTDELRALVAASAVVLSFGLPWYEWDDTRDILLYPTAFNEDYSHRSDGQRLGQVGSQGPIIFSAAALRAGFARGTDGHNVGFHEFAHVLDFDDGEIDGVPAHLNWEAIRPWLDHMGRHFDRRDRKGKARQVFRNYAYTNEAEFFACATEMFFEQPARLKARAPELYAQLAGFYGQELTTTTADEA